MALCSGGTFVGCVRRDGLIVMSVVLWVTVKIRSFGLMFGWVECRYGIGSINCLIRRC